jgi:tripartite-type tricarboxylate transporter receptor subunit TctC
MQDLIAGRIDYLCPLTALAISQIESRNVKALAGLSRTRSAVLPALASAHQQGLADFELSTWNAFFLPKGTSAAIVAKLRDATDAAISAPEMQERLKKIGADVVPLEHRSQDYLAKFVESEIAKWAVMIKAAGLTAE